MSKQGSDEIDEQEIIASFLADEPESHDALVGSEVPQQVASPRDEGRRRKGRDPDYEGLFIRNASVTARTGKMVYIRAEFHDTIQRITQVIRDNSLTLSGFIDNVLAHHFEIYKDEITRLYDRKYKSVFTQKH